MTHVVHSNLTKCIPDLFGPILQSFFIRVKSTMQATLKGESLCRKDLEIVIVMEMFVLCLFSPFCL